jgi:tRNA threonylcarbamoyladenosine biosynthesis protein TsaE
MTPVTCTEPELLTAARTLAEALQPGAVVWLQGDLGAGKSTFARAMIQATARADIVASPTYGLVHRYEGPQGPVYHVDCYRLRTPAEAGDLDWATVTNGSLLLIEWPERAGPWAPEPSHTVHLSHRPDPAVRELVIT